MIIKSIEIIGTDAVVIHRSDISGADFVADVFEAEYATSETIIAAVREMYPEADMTPTYVHGWPNETEVDIDTDRYEHPPYVWVAVYDISQACGGSEEGGWWYDCGTIVCDTPDVAPRLVPWSMRLDECDHMQTIADARNSDEGRRERSSVLSDGEYVAMIMGPDPGYGGLPPVYFPARRPQYE